MLVLSLLGGVHPAAQAHGTRPRISHALRLVAERLPVRLTPTLHTLQTHLLLSVRRRRRDDDLPCQRHPSFRRFFVGKNSVSGVS